MSDEVFQSNSSKVPCLLSLSVFCQVLFMRHVAEFLWACSTCCSWTRSRAAAAVLCKSRENVVKALWLCYLSVKEAGNIKGHWKSVVDLFGEAGSCRRTVEALWEQKGLTTFLNTLWKCAKNVKCTLGVFKKKHVAELKNNERQFN